MTSTNDEKEVKSNQPSGQKGKTYYIELYKLLEARLSEDCGLRTRTQHLCEAWRRVHSLCHHSAPTTHSHLLGWLQRHTAKTILQTEWQSPKSKDEQTTLSEAIEVFIQESNDAITKRNGTSPPWEHQLLQRAEWLKGILENPWGHPVLRALLNQQGKQPSDDEVLEWLKEERGVMFTTRLRQLASSKCDDLALLLASAVMDRARASIEDVPDAEQLEEAKDTPKAEPATRTFADTLRTDAGFTVDVWEIVTDLELVLLHKRDKHSQCIALAKKTPLRSGYQLVERLRSRLETSPREKKLWKNSKDVATLVAQVVIARCMVIPVCFGVARSALYCCTRSLSRLLEKTRLPKAAAALAAPAATARHLHTLASAVHAQSTDDMKPFVCELYVRAITAGMNEMEKLKLTTETEPEARTMEQTLCTWFTQMGTLLAASARIQCECLLTAFSVHASPTMYEKIKSAPELPPVVLDIEPKEETTSEFGSWASDSRSQTNFVKTSETLNLKQSQQKTNVLSTAIFAEGEALGLGAELCQDLTVCLSGPRVKTLSWDMDRQLLLDNCSKYMERTSGGTRAVTTELKYLNLDPSVYQHLPEEEDDENDVYYGIEKGYEHLVEFPEPEEIWQDSDLERTDTAYSTEQEFDFTDVRRKKKHKKRCNVLSSEEEIDPLSINTDVRTEKKKERPHSKERSKDSSKERKKKLDPEEVQRKKEAKEQKQKEKKERSESKERKKREKREKKERKKKETIQAEPKPGSLSNLVGMKVARIPSVDKSVTGDLKHGINDYDIQSKPLNYETDSSVVFDGHFSMDDIKSPGKADPLVDKQSLSKNQQSANGETAKKTPFIYGIANLDKTLSQNRVNPPVKDSKPAPVKNTHDIPRPQTYGTINEQVKRSISKLLQFRRQGHKAQNPNTTKPNANIEPKQANAIRKSDFPLAPFISPKAVAVPDIPKAYIDKQQIERLKEFETYTRPVIQHTNVAQPHYSVNEAPKAIPSTNCSPFQSPTNFKTNSYMQSPVNLKDIVKVPSYHHDNLNHISQQKVMSSSNAQSTHPFSYGTDPRLDNSRQPGAFSEKNLQDFLKELQESINAGTGSKAVDNKSIPYHGLTIKKEVKPMSRVPPIIPRTDPKSEMTSVQCAKQIIQQKKVENAPKTFSRLSYMHKNKQSDMRKQARDSMSIRKDQEAKQNISAELSRNITEFKNTKHNYIHHTKGDTVITRLESSSHGMKSSEPTNVIQKSDKRSIVNKEFPLISNILNANQTITAHQPISQTKNNVKSPSEYVSTTKVTQSVSPTAPIKSSYLSEKDQNDLLLLLRQQTRINAAGSTLRTSQNAHISNKMVTDSSLNKTSNPSYPNQAEVSPDNKIKSYNSEQKRDTHKTNPVLMSNVIVSNTKQNESHGKSVGIPESVIKTPINYSKTAPKNPAEKKKRRKNILKNAGSEQMEDWEIVMNAIRAQKTPSRVPSAIDLVQNSISLSDLRNQRIVRPNVTTVPEKASKITSDVIPETNTILKCPKPSAAAISKTTPRELPKPTQIAQKSLPETTNIPPKIDVMKRMHSEISKKQIYEMSTKEKDPFISGIENSDYDLLEELMDDDLRQEIGELSSDEDIYRGNVHSKGTKTTCSKNNNLIYKPTNTFTQKDKTNATNMKVNSKELRAQKPHTQLPNTKSTYTPKLPTETSKERHTVVTNKGNSNVINSSCIDSKAAAEAVSTLQTKNRQPESLALLDKGINKNSYLQTQIPDSRNLYLATVPPNPPAPSVVVIGSNVYYEPFNTIQSQMGISTMNQRYVPKSTSNMTVFHATPFVAPVINPLMISNSYTSPLVDSAFVSSGKVQPEATVNSSYAEVPLKSTKDNDKKNDIVKINVSDYVVGNQNKSEVEESNSTRTQINQPDNKTDGIINKICERKVLSEVQENQTISEKCDMKISKIQTITVDTKDSLQDVDKERIEPKCMRHKHTQRKPEMEIEFEEGIDVERLKIKRLAIIHRKISHQSQLAPIPLSYSPLIMKNEILLLNKATIDSVNHMSTVPQNIETSCSLNNQNNKSNPFGAENFKENKTTLQCRRILLRSSNKDVSKVSTNENDRNPIGRKTKVRLKNDNVVPATGVTENDTDVKKIRKARKVSVPVRRISNKGFTKRSRVKVVNTENKELTTATSIKPDIRKEIDNVILPSKDVKIIDTGSNLVDTNIANKDNKREKPGVSSLDSIIDKTAFIAQPEKPQVEEPINSISKELVNKKTITLKRKPRKVVSIIDQSDIVPALDITKKNRCKDETSKTREVNTDININDVVKNNVSKRKSNRLSKKCNSANNITNNDTNPMSLHTKNIVNESKPEKDINKEKDNSKNVNTTQPVVTNKIDEKINNDTMSCGNVKRTEQKNAELSASVAQNKATANATFQNVFEKSAILNINNLENDVPNMINNNTEVIKEKGQSKIPHNNGQNIKSTEAVKLVNSKLNEKVNVIQTAKKLSDSEPSKPALQRNKTAKDVDSSKIPESYKNSIRFEEIKNASLDNNTKKMRITLSSGRVFTATIYGQMQATFDSLFEDPAIKSILMSDVAEHKKYTLSIRQVTTTNKTNPSEPQETRIQEIQVQTKNVLPNKIETINLLSDDEEDEVSPLFTTEFGKYKTLLKDKDIIAQHQVKFNHKCIVKLVRLPINGTQTEETKESDQSEVEKVSQMCDKLNEEIIVPDRQFILPSIIKPNVTEIIEIDDSSNDSVNLLENCPNLPVALSGINEEMNDSFKLTRDVILSEIDTTNNTKDDPNSISSNVLMSHDKISEKVREILTKSLEIVNKTVPLTTTPITTTPITKECTVKLTKCDDLVEKYKIMNRKCFVDLIRLDDVSFSTTDNIDNEEIDDLIDLGSDVDLPMSSLSRCGSLSILNDFALTDDYDRTSPVMEVFETIASLSKTKIIEKSQESSSENIICECEWLFTKKEMRDFYIGSESESFSLSDEIYEYINEIISQEQNTNLYQVSTLTSLMSTFFQNNSIVYDLKPQCTDSYKIHTFNHLKRKLPFRNNIVSRKLSKNNEVNAMPNASASEKIYENYNKNDTIDAEKSGSNLEHVDIKITDVMKIKEYETPEEDCQNINKETQNFDATNQLPEILYEEQKGTVVNDKNNVDVCSNEEFRKEIIEKQQDFMHDGKNKSDLKSADSIAKHNKDYNSAMRRSADEQDGLINDELLRESTPTQICNEVDNYASEEILDSVDTDLGRRYVNIDDSVDSNLSPRSTVIPISDTIELKNLVEESLHTIDTDNSTNNCIVKKMLEHDESGNNVKVNSIQIDNSTNNHLLKELYTHDTEDNVMDSDIGQINERIITDVKKLVEATTYTDINIVDSNTIQNNGSFGETDVEKSQNDKLLDEFLEKQENLDELNVEQDIELNATDDIDESILPEEKTCLDSDNVEKKSVSGQKKCHVTYDVELLNEKISKKIIDTEISQEKYKNLEKELKTCIDKNEECIHGTDYECLSDTTHQTVDQQEEVETTIKDTESQNGDTEKYNIHETTHQIVDLQEQVNTNIRDTESQNGDTEQDNIHETIHQTVELQEQVETTIRDSESHIHETIRQTVELQEQVETTIRDTESQNGDTEQYNIHETTHQTIQLQEQVETTIIDTESQNGDTEQYNIHETILQTVGLEEQVEKTVGDKESQNRHETVADNIQHISTSVSENKNEDFTVYVNVTIDELDKEEQDKLYNELKTNSEISDNTLSNFENNEIRSNNTDRKISDKTRTIYLLNEGNDTNTYDDILQVKDNPTVHSAIIDHSYMKRTDCTKDNGIDPDNDLSSDWKDVDEKVVKEEKSDSSLNDSILETVTYLYRNGTDVVLKGIEYNDPIVGMCYVFPIADRTSVSSDSNTFNDNTEEVIEVMEEIDEEIVITTIEHEIEYKEAETLKVNTPKVTYSVITQNRDINLKGYRRKKNLKRKMDAIDPNVSRKKYRKGKNIDYPKISITSMSESTYNKEYKLVLDYVSSVKFSYSLPFHKEHIDVENMMKDWPIKGKCFEEPQSDNVDSHNLFVDYEEVPISQYSHINQTLAEEIAYEYKENNAVSTEINETNFKMGFGEGSGRVIQNLEDVGDISKVSAATLSDVKQTQPFLLSNDSKDCVDDYTNRKSIQYDEMENIRRCITYIQMRDKVKAFFQQTSNTLKYDLLSRKDSKHQMMDSSTFPFDLYIRDFIEPCPVEAIVQVVQVGQLPVSAAAQNPVTCDPRVTQVSDASPSQCSVENSPHDGSPSAIKTEYTELTTADLTLPLIQDYTQHNRAMPMDSHETQRSDENIPIETEIKSVVKIELMEELPDEKEEADFQENNDTQSLDNKHMNNVDYCYGNNNTNSALEDSNLQMMYDSPEKHTASENYPQQSVPEDFAQQQTVPEDYPQQQSGPDDFPQQQTVPQDFPQQQTVPDDFSHQQTVPENFAQQQKVSESFSEQEQQNGSAEKTDQIAHAMNAAGITTASETIANSRAQALVNMLSQKIRQGAITGNTQTTTTSFSKATSINAMALQQALAQILPPPLNQTSVGENNQQTSNTPQVLHIVQGKNAAGSQITLVDNSQSVISGSNATPVLHIVQNKAGATGATTNGAPGGQTNSFSGLSLVDAGLQQGGNQLLHIVNTGSQKNSNASQLLKRVNLLTNLANVQGSNDQKMVQFVCKSADGKAIQLNAPHQRSMVLRLQPIESPNVQSTVTKSENQELKQTAGVTTSNNKDANSQEIKSRSVYEENYAKFIQSSNKPTAVPVDGVKSTSLPKFNQAFGKPVFQEGNQKTSDVAGNNMSSVNSGSSAENSECQPNESMNLDHIGAISSPPLLLRKSPAQNSQPQQNLVQQIKQTIAPMNIQTMHGGVIYTRQIPVNIGGGQTINLITVPSTELIDESGQKQQNVNQGEMEPSIIKIVPQSQTVPNSDSSDDNASSHMGVSNDNPPTPQPQPVLTQMRIKLPMLSKTPQMVSGARVVRPSFFQIQRNVIGGANQPVYQQLVLTAAPPLGQQTIRLPQASRIKVPSESQSSAESQMSSSTLEQLREFDMVLEQVKERSTVQPNANTSTFSKLHTPSTDTTDNATSASSTPTEPTPVLYSIGNNQPLNVAYVNRKATVTTPAASAFVRSPDSSGIVESPTSSTHVQIPRTVTTEASATETATQPKPAKVGSKSKSRPKSSSHLSNSMKLNSVPPKTSTQKPLEDEQTTQRILYILAEYKEQVENSPDKDKPAPRRRSNPPSNPSGSSKRKKSSSGSRRSGHRDMSPVHGDDTCRTMGSEDSSCGTSQGDCNESCLDSHSPQDSPRKIVRKLTFEQETPIVQPRPQPQRNVIVADGQTITVARGTAGKPTTAVLMPANYILPVSMVKGGQQIAIVTNRGPKLLTVGGGEGGATNALLLQRLIGPAGLKPVLARPGVRHVRLPTAALHNLQAFNLATATTIQPPDSTASPAPAPTPPELVETRANSSPWTDRESQDVKPERGSSPEGSEPWNMPSSADPHDYSYEETVRADHMDRTVLVVHKKDGATHRRLNHVSAAALRHKYAILEHELRLQKSLSEECEDLGVDSPSASELFPEAELLFANSPAHDHAPEQGHHSHTPQPTILNQSGIPQPDMDDQIATDQLLQRDVHDDRNDINLGLEDVGIVTVSEDGMQATIALDHEEFAKSHPNTTFHSEPTEEGEVQPFTIAGLKGRHITSTIFHSNRAPATVLMTAPQTTVISQATAEPNGGVKYADIDNMINSMPSSHGNNINLSSVLVKDDGLTRFDSILNDSRELHLTNTASAIVHSTGNATQVIRRVCYEDKRDRDTSFLMDEPDALIAGDDAKMIGEDSSRDATLESMTGDVDDDRSSPERHTELFWESNSASERSESRRPLDFSSDSDKCCKSPSYDETNSTDSSGVGTHMRLDSVIKDARGMERSGSADGSSADDTHPPLRTYPPKRMYHALDGEMERSLTGKTRAGERSPDLEVRRRASVRGVVKRGCHCCNGSPAPPRPKKPRQRKPTLDFSTH